MDINKCKGCQYVVYTKDMSKSWCWLTTTRISKIYNCQKQMSHGGGTSVSETVDGEERTGDIKDA